MFSMQLQASKLLGSVSATQVKNNLSVFQKRVGAVLFGIALIGGMLAGNMLLKGTSKQAFTLVLSGALLATAIVVATQVLPDAKKADEQEAAQAEEEIVIQMSEVEDDHRSLVWKQEKVYIEPSNDDEAEAEVPSKEVERKKGVDELRAELERNKAHRNKLEVEYNDLSTKLDKTIREKKALFEKFQAEENAIKFEVYGPCMRVEAHLDVQILRANSAGKLHTELKIIEENLQQLAKRIGEVEQLDRQVTELEESLQENPIEDKDPYKELLFPETVINCELNQTKAHLGVPVAISKGEIVDELNVANLVAQKINGRSFVRQMYLRNLRLAERQQAIKFSFVKNKIEKQKERAEKAIAQLKTKLMNAAEEKLTPIKKDYEDNTNKLQKEIEQIRAELSAKQTVMQRIQQREHAIKQSLHA